MSSQQQSRNGMTRITGCPGAGKTYRTAEIVKNLRDSGLEPTDVVFATFTNSHRKDVIKKWKTIWSDWVAREGAKGVRDDPYETMKKQCNTFHSHVLRSLPIGYIEDYRKQIIEPSDDQPASEDDDLGFIKKFWGEQRGLEFIEEDDPLQMIRRGETPDGKANKLMAADQWLSQMCCDVTAENLYESPVDVPMQLAAAVDHIEAWRDHKRSTRHFEHHDYVRAAREEGFAPNCEVAIVDEIQDYSESEMRLVKQWREQGIEVIVAGDPDQSIYGFKGAQPSLMKDLVADQSANYAVSRRCPAEIANVANALLGEERMYAAETGGNLHKTDELASGVADAIRLYTPEGFSSLDDPDTPVQVLSRTNWQVAEIQERLMEYGIPFNRLDDGYNPWTDGDLNMVRASSAVRQMQSSSPVPRAYMKELLKMASNTEDRVSRLQRIEWGGVSPDVRMVDPWSAFPDVNSVREAVSRLNASDMRKKMLMGIVRSDLTIDPNRVKVGTIHASKGSECRCVVLSDAYSKSMKKRFHRDDTFNSEERRVYYVAVTRADTALVLSQDDIGSRTCPFFSDGMPMQLDDPSKLVRDPDEETEQ